LAFGFWSLTITLCSLRFALSPFPFALCPLPLALCSSVGASQPITRETYFRSNEIR
jgi:hypothetical protein